MKKYTNKVSNWAEWELFLNRANRNKLYFDRDFKEFIDLEDMKNITAQQIEVVEDMYDTDLSLIKNTYGYNEVY